MNTLISNEDLAEDAQKGRFQDFLVGNESFGIEIRYVTEIIGIQSITEMPDMPNFVKGIINLRGRIIPLIDVRLRFGKEPKAYDDRTCVIVVGVNGFSYGLDRGQRLGGYDDTGTRRLPRSRESTHPMETSLSKNIGKTASGIVPGR